MYLAKCSVKLIHYSIPFCVAESLGLHATMVPFWKIITVTAVLLSLSYDRSNGLREGPYDPTGI